MKKLIRCAATMLGYVITTSHLAAQALPTQAPAKDIQVRDWFPRIDRLAKPESADERGNDEERIETDRDSFTPATKTVAKGRFILESAYSFIDNKGVAETHSVPEMILRYGVTKRLELRVGWNYEVGGAGNEVSGNQADSSLDETGSRSKIVREQRISYGFKWQATEQHGWMPESAVLIQASTPTGGDSTATQLTGAYIFGWKLANSWKTDFALRYGTGSEEGDHFGVWAPSAVLRVPIGERWNVHGEYFGLFSQDKSSDFVRHYFSPGIHYLVTNDLEVGIRVGWGLNDQASRFFANVGFGLRF